MEREVIKRRGSYFYARAYLKIALAATLIYIVAGALLATVAANILDSALAGAIFMALTVALMAAAWVIYGAVLWSFRWRSRQAVEIIREGIRETGNGREKAFIPWPGVKEIEVAATIVAGASLRVKGNFCEITISNVDLQIPRLMSVGRMHTALAETEEINRLLRQFRAAAPQAALRMNRLARLRMNLDTQSYERQV